MGRLMELHFGRPWILSPSRRAAAFFGGTAGEHCWDGTFGGMDHRPHIVVVEDEAAQRQLLVDYLGKQNFRVTGTDGGTALRKLLERELPALVLLDIGLPGEDGFVLARWL